jgi:hypothetical protein
MAAATPAVGGASISDILTAIKNIALLLGTLATDFLNVNGQINAAGIVAPFVVSTKAGRLASVSIIVGGAATGLIYDGANLSATSKPLYVIPTTVGVFVVNIPVSFGVLVVPGSGQTVTVSYS